MSGASHGLAGERAGSSAELLYETVLRSTSSVSSDAAQAAIHLCCWCSLKAGIEGLSLDSRNSLPMVSQFYVVMSPVAAA